MHKKLAWKKTRKFGIEYELNNNPTTESQQKLRDIVSEFTGMPAETRSWEHTNNNPCWVCKTDSSCGRTNEYVGTELVSPPLSGYKKLKKAAELLPVLEENGYIFNDRCGMHIHVDAHDLDREQVGIVASYWLKIEHLFMDSLPTHRKNNNYCKIFFENLQIRKDTHYTPEDIYNKCRRDRQFSLNVRSYEQRQTLEFRFGHMSFDPEVVKNRVRFLIWFIDIAKHLPPPENLNFINIERTFIMLNLLNQKDSVVTLEFSSALQSMKKWFLNEYITYCSEENVKDKRLCQKILTEIEESENQNED